MLVVIANDLPPAVRGRMKLWFIEPRANVFVSGIKDSVADTVINYLHEHCPIESGVMILKSTHQPPYYTIRSIGPTRKNKAILSGLELIIEKQLDTD